MLPDDYETLDATSLSERVRRREIEPGSLLEQALARIAAVDAKVGAVVSIDADAAREDARRLALDAPFAGVPMLIKDTSVDVAGMSTRHGSKFFADAPPAAADSDFVRRLRRAGCLIIGKSKT
ncbi:MAG TPA: amidase family protein, partial [Pseudomonadota bacterium]|nr:amidase family protein [Pseudomonadota bacterium]